LPEPTLVVKVGKYGLAHKNVPSMMTMQKHAEKGHFVESRAFMPFL